MIKKIINSNIVRLIGALLFLTVCETRSTQESQQTQLQQKQSDIHNPSGSWNAFLPVLSETVPVSSAASQPEIYLFPVPYPIS